MATLTCDICDGKLVIGAGGVATCAECGMEHSMERIKEKLSGTTSTVASSVGTDHTGHLKNIETLLMMAKNAVLSENYAEVETYASRVIEIDPTIDVVWHLKGLAAGWQSTNQNCRLQETATAFIKCFQCSSSHAGQVSIDTLGDDIQKIAIAIVRLKGKEFQTDPVEAETFKSLVRSIIKSVDFFCSTTGFHAPNLNGNIMLDLCNFGMKTWHTEVITRLDEDDGHPSKYELEAFVEETDVCTELILFGTTLYDYDPSIYSTLIKIENMVCTTHWWEKRFDQFGMFYNIRETIPSDQIRARKLKIAQYEKAMEKTEQRIAAKKRMEAQADENERKVATAEFWKKYSSERLSLETQREFIVAMLELSNAEKTITVTNYLKSRLREINKIVEAEYKLTNTLPVIVNILISDFDNWKDKHSAIRLRNIDTIKEQMQKQSDLKSQIAEQDAIIAQNKGFFGEPARIRKAALQTKAALQSQLATYSDLS
jgi:hypothetical protein